MIFSANLAKVDEIFAKLTKAAKENGHFKVYTPKTLPSRWHAKNARRMGPIIALADGNAKEGYGFQDLMKAAKDYEKKYNITSEYSRQWRNERRLK